LFCKDNKKIKFLLSLVNKMVLILLTRVYKIGFILLTRVYKKSLSKIHILRKA